MTNRICEILPGTIRCVVAVAVLGGALAGCTSGNHSSTSGLGASAASNNSPSAPHTGNAAVIDACSLVAGGDISNLLGTPVQGQSTSTDPQSPGCKWENPSTDESVSVAIGNPGTAANNTLAPAEPGFEGTPGTDGMRSWAAAKWSSRRATARTPFRSRCCACPPTRPTPPRSTWRTRWRRRSPGRESGAG